MKKKAVVDQNLLSLLVERKLVGEYVVECEKKFTAALTDFAGQSCELNLSRATMVDSSGIGLCVGIYKECKQRSIAFTIVASHDMIKFFKMLKLDKVLDLRETEVV